MSTPNPFQRIVASQPAATARFVVLPALFACLPMWFVGCRKAADVAEPDSVVAVQATSFRAEDARQYLLQVFGRYRNAASYHDRAVVRLQFRVAGQLTSKTAPLQLWYNQGQLYLEAYDARLWSDARGLMAWSAEVPHDDLSAQVLHCPPVTGRPSIEFLFRDPILRQQVSSGLAGPPPQIDWLFSSAPMKHLFAASHRFEFGRDQQIDNHRCRRVDVDTGDETYVFWIAQHSGIIRRIEFPAVQASPDAVGEPQLMQLTLDLIGASFDAPAEGPSVTPLPSKPNYVSRFVPLPPPAPANVIGRRPQPFTATTLDGRTEISDRGSPGATLMIYRHTATPGSATALQVLRQWKQQFPAQLRSQVQLLILADPSIANGMSPPAGLPVVADQDDRVARALDLAPNMLAIQESNGRVAWIHADFSAAGLVTLGAILGDVIGGIDVPQRIQQQWQEQVEAYRTEVEQVTVR